MTIQTIKIIYMDDDEDDQAFFVQALAKIEVQTSLKSFKDSDTLLTHLNALNEQNPAPDIIFLDINVPRKNGLICLREIREKQSFQNIPIIMFTNSYRPLDIDESYLWGANLYIKKPDGFHELVNTLSKLFSQQWYSRLKDMGGKKMAVHKVNSGLHHYSPIFNKD